MKSATMTHRVPVKSVAAPVTLGAAWRGGNEKKRNCQERDHRYTFHYCLPAERVDPQSTSVSTRGRTLFRAGSVAFRGGGYTRIP